MRALPFLAIPGLYLGLAGNIYDRPFWEFVGGGLLLVASYGLIRWAR